MLRLVKYLKPYTLLILLAIALLFVQANADLALPDYLSDIVNVGIQQGGVANAVPVAIRQSEMNKLTLFMSPADKTRVLSAYTLVDQNSADLCQRCHSIPHPCSRACLCPERGGQCRDHLAEPRDGQGISGRFGHPADAGRPGQRRMLWPPGWAST